MQDKARNPITRSGRGFRVKIPSKKLNRMVECESTLERDAVLLFEFSPGVMKFQEQPERVYYDHNGITSRYFPDFEVQLRNRTTIHVEVKPLVKLVAFDTIKKFNSDAELADHNGMYLRELGLGVLELTPDENELVQNLFATSKGLSIADCSALVCAMRAEHSLMTGDRLLRKEAEARQADVRGLLWLLDHMQESGTALTLLHEALNKISNHPTCRLPKDEVKKRLQNWSTA